MTDRVSLPSDFRVVVADPLSPKADPLSPKMEALFRSLLPPDLLAYPAGDSQEEIVDRLRDARALLARRRPISAKIVSAGPELRIVHVLGRHPDPVDIEAARRRNIVVATMPHGGAMAVADHTLALLLAVARRIVAGHRGVVDGEYERTGKFSERTSEWSFAFNWLSFPDIVEIKDRHYVLRPAQP